MIHRYLLRTFQIAFKVSTAIGVVPYDYKLREQKVYVSKSWWKQVASLFCWFLFSMKMLYTVIGLISLSQTEEGLTGDIHAMSLLLIHGMIFYNKWHLQMTIWKCKRDYCWIFNQITDFRRTTILKKRLTFGEMVMLTWIPGHLNTFFSLLTDFIRNPTGRHHFFSILPQNVRDFPGVYHFFFLCEGWAIFGFIWTSMFEFSAQVLLMKAMIYWTNELGNAELKNNEQINNTFKSYQKVAIIVRNFNNTFSSNIEHIKTTFTVFSVACNFIMLRYYAVLPVNLIMPLVDWITFCHSLPPLLYNNAYKIHVQTTEAKRRISKAQVNIIMPDDRRVCRMMGKSLCPLSIRVMGLYFLDRTMTPMYLRIIVDNTIALLLSY